VGTYEAEKNHGAFSSPELQISFLLRFINAGFNLAAPTATKKYEVQSNAELQVAVADDPT
jgi:hypothetical protein